MSSKIQIAGGAPFGWRDSPNLRRSYVGAKNALPIDRGKIMLFAGSITRTLCLRRREGPTRRGEIVKLAEALSMRADSVRRIEQLRARIVGNARYQEGEEPAEDAVAMLAEVEEVLSDYQSLIRRINHTNTVTSIGTDGTLTDALAHRDVLRLRHSVVTAAADAAAGKGHPAYARQLRSELKMFSALPVGELRARADVLARELRELDVRIQRSNWEVELLD